MPVKEDKLDLEQKDESTPTFVPSPEEEKAKKYFTRRIEELKQARLNVFGVNIEDKWRDADREYLPRKLGISKKKRVLSQETEDSWATSRRVILGEDKWQSDSASTNPYVKVQVALSILASNNPEAVFSAGAPQYEAYSKLQDELYKHTWDVARSGYQLRLFMFNLAKYGFAIARTYPKYLAHPVNDIKEYNAEDPSKSTYEERMFVEYNDVYRENLNPWDCWVDDMAKPYDRLSCRDWAWHKVYAWEDFEQQFGDLKNFKYVRKQSGGGVTKVDQTRYVSSDSVEVYFYENRLKDLYYVETEKVPLIVEPLPYQHKQLSCWFTHWNLRHAESIFGIGLIEAMKNDVVLYDKIKNMTMDQLVMSIYKAFFHENPDAFSGEQQQRIKPGVGIQARGKVTFLEVPGPGAEAWRGIEVSQGMVDESSGISKPLAGEITGKTAFEVANSKEGALKRIKIPLDNIIDALENEAELSRELIEQIYSVPEVYRIASSDDIAAYLEEVGSDPELYRIDEKNQFYARSFRELPLNVKTEETPDGKVRVVLAEDKKFFRLKPEALRWKGSVKIKAQSVVSSSKLLDKQTDLEMANLLIPLLAGPPELNLKPAKQILKIYEKDPKDWLPDSWLQPGLATAGAPIPGAPPTGVSPSSQVPGAPTVVPSEQVGVTRNEVQSVSQQLTNAAGG